jgi:hypothetical protein
LDVKLKNGAVALIDDEDARYIGSYEWDVMATGHVTAMTRLGDGTPYVHVLDHLLCAAPEGHLVVHVNGRLLDCRRANLQIVEYRPYRRRPATSNRNSLSGVRGIQNVANQSPTRPWRAQVSAQKHNYHLGVFATQEEAIAMRRAANLCLFGENGP